MCVIQPRINPLTYKRHNVSPDEGETCVILRGSYKRAVISAHSSLVTLFLADENADKQTERLSVG